jgi:peptide/nickel transport system permease protein
MCEREKRLNVLPFVWLTVVYLAVLAADFLAPYDPSEQRRNTPWMAWTPIHFFENDGWFQPRPFVCRTVSQEQDPTAYGEDCRQRFPIRWFITRGTESNASEKTLHLFGVDEPASVHLFGTDQYGRD